MPVKTSVQKNVPTSTYVIISVVSVVAAAAIGYYYFHFMKQQSTERMDDRVFYLVLILFGVAASALIFGIMNSYASLKGIQSNVTYKFTGPAVGVILIVLGGFMLPKGSTNNILSMRIVDEDNNPVTSGTVTLTFPHYQVQNPISSEGLAVFADVPHDQLTGKIDINVVSDGYSPVSIDTVLSNFDKMKITLAQAKVIRVSGTVKDAADNPIRNVQVSVDGTPYAATTINDGSFDIPLPGYHFGDHITIVTSHPLYEDKAKEFDIQSGKINDIEFVLNPVPPQNLKKKTK